MKNKSTLLILVVIVAIAMVGLYLAMGLKDSKTTQQPITQNKETAVALAGLENVTYVQYINAEETVTLVKEEDVWKSEAKPELKLVVAYVQEKVDLLNGISGTVVADAKKADCGLEEPAYTLIIKNEKSSVKIYVGYNGDGVYYAMVDGNDTIYEVKDSYSIVMDMDLDSYSETADDMSYYYESMEGQEEVEDTVGDEDIVDDSIVEENPDAGTAGDELLPDDTVEEPSEETE